MRLSPRQNTSPGLWSQPLKKAHGRALSWSENTGVEETVPLQGLCYHHWNDHKHGLSLLHWAHVTVTAGTRLSCALRYHQRAARSHADSSQMPLAEWRHRRLWPHLMPSSPRVPKGASRCPPPRSWSLRTVQEGALHTTCPRQLQRPGSPFPLPPLQRGTERKQPCSRWRLDAGNSGIVGTAHPCMYFHGKGRRSASLIYTSCPMTQVFHIQVLTKFCLLV